MKHDIWKVQSLLLLYCVHRAAYPGFFFFLLMKTFIKVSCSQLTQQKLKLVIQIDVVTLFLAHTAATVAFYPLFVLIWPLQLLVHFPVLKPQLFSVEDISLSDQE